MIKPERRGLAAAWTGGIAAFLAATAVASWAHEGPHKAEPRLMLTQSQALAKAFPGSTIERKTAYLDKAQLERAAMLSGCRHDSAVVSYYLAQSTMGVVGAAFFESHRLRDGRETIMAALTPEGRLLRSEILSFDEPADYMPPNHWRAGLLGRTLGELERFSRPPGASPRAALSAQAFLDGVRRLMAVYEVAELRKENP